MYYFPDNPVYDWICKEQPDPSDSTHRIFMGTAYRMDDSDNGEHTLRYGYSIVSDGITEVQYPPGILRNADYAGNNGRIDCHILVKETSAQAR